LTYCDSGVTMKVKGVIFLPKKTFFNIDKAKQRTITSSAVDVFVRDGYDNASVAQIIKQANIPRGSFYQYFEGKQDLFLYCMEIYQEKKLKMFEPILSQIGSKPFLDLYLPLVEYGLKFARKYPKAQLIGLQLFKSNDLSLENVLKHFQENGVKMIEDYLKIDQEKGFIKPNVDINTLAMMLYRLNARDILEMLYSDEKSDEEILSVTKKTLDIILNGALEDRSENNI